MKSFDLSMDYVSIKDWWSKFGSKWSGYTATTSYVA